MGLGVCIEKQWGSKRIDAAPFPEFQELTCVFLRIGRWHGPTAEELVARGEGLGVPQGVSKLGNVDHCVGVFDVGKQQRDDSHSTIP